MQNKIHHLLNLHPNKTQITLTKTTLNKTIHTTYQKLNNEIQEIQTTNQAFEVGSIAKVFTSYVLCQLVLENKVNLNDPLSKFLPKITAFQKYKITLEQLSNHTSGLPRLPDNFYQVKDYDEADPYRHYYESDLLDYLKGIDTLETQPGEKVNYSNLGAGLLSYILSKVENQPFATMVRQRIFQPFGMRNSTYEFQDLNVPLVVGLDPQGNPSSNWYGGILNGCIGAISTASDMAKFIKAMLVQNDPAINLQTKRTATISQNHHMGLGWGIRNWESGITTYNHGGGSAGYLAFLKINRAEQHGICMLSNVSAFHERAKDWEALSYDFLSSEI